MTTSQDPSAAAEEERVEVVRNFWVQHAANNKGVTAVEPRIKWLGYHALSRRALQRWTIGRLQRDRPRYKLGVDLGCGNGEWTELIAPLCDEIHACDFSPDFVAEVTQRTSWHRACHVEVADLRNYKVPEGADLVYLGAAFMYVEDADVKKVLAHVRERVAPGAHVVIRDYCAFNFGMRTAYARGSIHRPASHLVKFATEAGFKLLELRSSFSIYGELAAGWIPGLQWPLRGLFRVATIPWTRASHTLRFYA